MSNESITQETTGERLLKNTGAFRAEYERLNRGEQKQVQVAFCTRYNVAPVAFRARLAGTTRTSDTELAWMEEEVAKYFPVKQ
ncbi:hypothetical protein [Spirosoma litoris]